MGGVPKVLWAVGPVPWLEGWSYGCQAVQSCKKDESECVSRMDQSVQAGWIRVCKQDESECVSRMDQCRQCRAVSRIDQSV